MPTVKKIGQKPATSTTTEPKPESTIPANRNVMDAPPANRFTGTTVMDAPPANHPSNQIAIPDFLTQTGMPETQEQQLTGYVGFGEPKSVKNWPIVSAAGVKEGQAYAARQGEIIPLESLKFWLLRADSFQTAMKSDGSFAFATRDLELPDPGTFGGAKLSAHYIGLMIIELPGNRFIPIKGDFRTTKTGALAGPINAVKVAATPEWANQGDAYRIAAQFPQPFGRVFHTVTTQFYVAKSNGNSSYPAKCTTAPTTVTQMQTLNRLFQDQEFLSQLMEANTNYVARVAFFNDLIGKQNKG